MAAYQFVMLVITESLRAVAFLMALRTRGCRDIESKLMIQGTLVDLLQQYIVLQNTQRYPCMRSIDIYNMVVRP